MYKKYVLKHCKTIIIMENNYFKLYFYIKFLGLTKLQILH